MDLNEKLAAIDGYLGGLLLDSSVQDVQAFILDLLQRASEHPGRGAKLRVTYVMERMAELVKDLKEEHAKVRQKDEGFMRWIDRGLVYAAYLADPDSQGRWLESFDQTLMSTQIPDPKDPDEARRRRDEAAELQRKWTQTLAKMPAQRRGDRNSATEPRRPGRGGGDNLIVLPR